ncbi:hypothetical protein D3C86_1092490 [compost metagenome]
MIYKSLTLKEIKIIFQHTFDLKRSVEYLSYRRSAEEYDVVEENNQIFICYQNTTDWKLPITAARSVYK